MLRRNLRGFFLRVTPLLAITFVGLSWGYEKINADRSEEWLLEGRVTPLVLGMNIITFPGDATYSVDGYFQKRVFANYSIEGTLTLPLIEIVPGADYESVPIKLTRDNPMLSFDYRTRRIVIKEQIQLRKLPPYNPTGPAPKPVSHP
jgi:hypothetical protein